MHVTLIIRDGQKQIESLENEWNKGGILTIASFKKGNVSKLLFGNKNFSPSIINRIEKLLLPTKGSKLTKKIIILTEDGIYIANGRFIPNK